MVITEQEAHLRASQQQLVVDTEDQTQGVEAMEAQAEVVQEALIVAEQQDKVMADQAEMEASMAEAEAAEKAAQVAAAVQAEQEHHITDTQLQAAVAVEDLVVLVVQGDQV